MRSTAGLMRALCIGGALLVAPALLAQPAQAGSQKTREQLLALIESHTGDFDYLLGEWAFTSQSAEYGKGQGVWTAVRLEGGYILDEYRVVGDSGETYYHSATLRVYNAARDLWELVSAEQGAGLQNTGTGRKVGNEMHIEQTFEATTARPTLLRIRYYDIRPDAFSWRADRSVDGGKTWTKDHLRIEARRIGPARTLPSLAPVRRP